ncbi:MAG: acyl-CoA thioester hydrolase [Puniceicoccaceae bacterium 5H]|nr:MAG: acyl-CoA thioester hydrolase [Puniceicoccaceae bacterium 5H]
MSTECRFTYRVRYAETDQMGTFYNARALEWFEVGRSELARAMGLPYREWEERGVYLPLIEAHVRFRGRAQYDDLLEMTVRVEQERSARLRFSNEVVHAESRQPVCEGYTIHALINAEGRPVRIPDWVQAMLQPQAG